MKETVQWDWKPGSRVIANLAQWKKTYAYMEEPQFRPDGEQVAAIVKTPDGEYTVCVNGQPWENSYDRIWFLRYGPEGRLSGCVSADMEWTVATDDRLWESRFDYVWDLQTSLDGKDIAVAAQAGGEYLGVVNDRAWEQPYAGLTDLKISAQGGHIAASVQVEAIKEGDIFKFQEGCYALAVDGQCDSQRYVNVWTPAGTADGSRHAAAVRTSLYDYSVVVDDRIWDTSFACLWAPKFHPGNGAVTVPAKTGAQWTMVKDGQRLWKRDFVMIHEHAYDADGNRMGALVAPKFGRWTVAVDGIPWSLTFGDLVSDLTFSSKGKCIACTGKDKGRWTVAVDGSAWPGGYDMVYAPVFSQDEKHVAAVVETKGQKTVAVDGKPLNVYYRDVSQPVFSPDNDHVLFSTVAAEEPFLCERHVMPLSQFAK